MPASAASCSQAFEKLPAIDHHTGIFTLVSDKLAMTLTQCGSASEWKTELAKRPEVVGENIISDDYLDEFFDGACSFLAEMGHSSPICTE